MAKENLIKLHALDNKVNLGQYLSLRLSCHNPLQTAMPAKIKKSSPSQ